MNQVHPSRWRIQKTSDKRFCQELQLPLGPDGPKICVSTKLFNKIFALWDPRKRSFLAGEFAQALRELRSSRVDLKQIPQIKAYSVDDCYLWLDLYEIKLVEYGIELQKAEKTAAPAKKPGPVSGDLYEKLLLIAAREYIILFGPMGDTALVAEKACAVARACAGG